MEAPEAREGAPAARGAEVLPRMEGLCEAEIRRSTSAFHQAEGGGRGSSKQAVGDGRACGIQSAQPRLAAGTELRAGAGPRPWPGPLRRAGDVWRQGLGLESRRRGWKGQGSHEVSWEERRHWRRLRCMCVRLRR